MPIEYKRVLAASQPGRSKAKVKADLEEVCDG
jgi:hypothetical protein